MMEPPIVIERFGSHLWAHGLTLVPWVVVLVATIIAAITDTRTRKIPNAVTFPLFLVGMMWAAVVGGWMGMADAMLGALAAMAPFFVLFVLARGGAGDAKLMAGVGAWLGLNGAVIALASVTIAGGLIALVLMIAKRKGSDTWTGLTWIFWALWGLVFGKQTRQDTLLPSVHGMQAMPYGLPILVGVIATLGVTLA